MGVDLDFRLGSAAVQLGLMTAGQFTEAVADWGSRREVGLGEILIERGWIDRVEFQCLVRLLSREGELPDLGGGSGRLPQERQERYSWKKMHAEGGLGQIWLAHDELLHRDVALKRIRIRLAASAEARSRFLKEAEITGQLQHPNIVPVYDLGRLSQDGQPFYVMKMVGGQNLSAVVAEHHGAAVAGKVDAAGRRRLLELFSRICDALEYAHSRRVVHRDLKPDNIMVGEFGEVIVLDWGLAKILDGPDPVPANLRVTISEDARGVASRDELKGAPAYMSPEQAQRRFDQIDERTDVYGLGTILFEILTGSPPHVGGTIPEILGRIGTGPTPRARSIAPSVPVGLEEICAQAMAYAQADRFSSVAELVRSIKRWLADEPVTVYRSAVENYRQLALEKPGSPSYLAELARNQTILGLVLSGLDRNVAAEAELSAAIDGLERVISSRPTVITYRAELAANRVHLHNVLMALGRSDEAGRSRSQAEAEYENLIRADPIDAHHRIAFTSALKTFGLGPGEINLRMSGLPAEQDGSTLGISTHAEGEFDWGGLFDVLVDQLQLLDTERFLEACELVPSRGKSLVDWLIEKKWIDRSELPKINARLGQSPRIRIDQIEIELRDGLLRSLPAHGIGKESPSIPVSTPTSSMPTLMSQDDDTVLPDFEEASAELRPSTPVSRFRILRPLSRGSLGIISVAIDTELNREVALKEIRDEFADHPQVRARFVREAEIAAGLEHPRIVTIYGMSHYLDGRPYYAMRLIRGESLKLAIQKRRGGELPGGRKREDGDLHRLLRRFRAACEAIAFAHSRGVLHRDLKPGNIMVGDLGETVVVDWGLAKVLGRDESDEPALGSWGGGPQETRAGSVIGTPAYMSPEQAEGRLADLGPACDIYGLGATLYEILCGVAPYPSQDLDEVMEGARRGDFPPPSQVRADVPAELEAICLKALAWNPADRHRSPGALARAVQTWLRRSLD